MESRHFFCLERIEVCPSADYLKINVDGIFMDRRERDSEAKGFCYCKMMHIEPETETDAGHTKTAP